KLELIRKDKAEVVGTSKTLTSGFMMLKAGQDIGMSAKGALSTLVGGPIVERGGGNFTIAARAIVITALTGLKMTVGGSHFDASSGKVTVKASSLGGGGGPLLKLSCQINYKD